MSFHEQGCELLFIDETSIQAWRTGMKTWQPQDKTFFQPLLTQRGKSVSILGCISSKQPGFCYYISPRPADGAAYKLLLIKVAAWAQVSTAVSSSRLFFRTSSGLC